jgi:putative sterol carrier protein
MHMSQCVTCDVTNTDFLCRTYNKLIDEGSFFMADIAKLFENMPSQFNADLAGDMKASILFDLTGDGGGQWTAVIADGACEIEQGAVDAPTATLCMDADDYQSMIDGDLNAMTAFMTGKIKVEGDLGTIMKMQSVFGM